MLVLWWLADIYRPKQPLTLKTLGQQSDVPVFALGTEVPAVEIVRQGLEQAQTNHNDYVLIDTAGRVCRLMSFMNELRVMKALAQPNEKSFVVDAIFGQRAATKMRVSLMLYEVTGVILTKIDGDTRGGAALCLFVITLKPIKFTQIREKITDIETPSTQTVSRAVSGMGGICSLWLRKLLRYEMNKKPLKWLRRCAKTPLILMISSIN